MITKEEIKELEGNYFEVLQTGAFAITLKGHYWHMLEREYSTFRHLAIYHKRNAIDAYHA